MLLILLTPERSELVFYLLLHKDNSAEQSVLKPQSTSVVLGSKIPSLRFRHQRAKVAVSQLRSLQVNMMVVICEVEIPVNTSMSCINEESPAQADVYQAGFEYAEMVE